MPDVPGVVELGTQKTVAVFTEAGGNRWAFIVLVFMWCRDAIMIKLQCQPQADVDAGCDLPEYPIEEPYEVLEEAITGGDVDGTV